jgi:hypothetical protein
VISLSQFVSRRWDQFDEEKLTSCSKSAVRVDVMKSIAGTLRRGSPKSKSALISVKRYRLCTFPTVGLLALSTLVKAKSQIYTRSS